MLISLNKTLICLIMLSRQLAIGSWAMSCDGAMMSYDKVKTPVCPLLYHHCATTYPTAKQGFDAVFCSLIWCGSSLPHFAELRMRILTRLPHQRRGPRKQKLFNDDAGRTVLMTRSLMQNRTKSNDLAVNCKGCDGVL